MRKSILTISVMGLTIVGLSYVTYMANKDENFFRNLYSAKMEKKDAVTHYYANGRIKSLIVYRDGKKYEVSVVYYNEDGILYYRFFSEGKPLGEPHAYVDDVSLMNELEKAVSEKSGEPLEFDSFKNSERDGKLENSTSEGEAENVSQGTSVTGEQPSAVAATTTHGTGGTSTVPGGSGAGGGTPGAGGGGTPSSPPSILEPLINGDGTIIPHIGSSGGSSGQGSGTSVSGGASNSGHATASNPVSAQDSPKHVRIIFEKGHEVRKEYY